MDVLVFAFARKPVLCRRHHCSLNGRRCRCACCRRRGRRLRSRRRHRHRCIAVVIIVVVLVVVEEDLPVSWQKEPAAEDSMG